MKRKSIRKSLWGAYWKLHDKKKMLAARLKGYLDGLPPKTRRRIVLAMLAALVGVNFGVHNENVDVFIHCKNVIESAVTDIVWGYSISVYRWIYSGQL